MNPLGKTDGLVGLLEVQLLLPSAEIPTKDGSLESDQAAPRRLLVVERWSWLLAGLNFNAGWSNGGAHASHCSNQRRAWGGWGQAGEPPPRHLILVGCLLNSATVNDFPTKRGTGGVVWTVEQWSSHSRCVSFVISRPSLCPIQKSHAAGTILFQVQGTTTGIGEWQPCGTTEI